MKHTDPESTGRDRTGGPGPWCRLGRMLPHSLRTRVFEPAYYDLLSEYGPRSQKRIGFGLQVLGLTFNSYRVGGPRMVLEFVRSQTPAAWAVAGIAGLMALFVAVQYVLRAGGAYGE